MKFIFVLDARVLFTYSSPVCVSVYARGDFVIIRVARFKSAGNGASCCRIINGNAIRIREENAIIFYESFTVIYVSR